MCVVCVLCEALILRLSVSACVVVNKREVDKPLTSQIWKEMRRFQYHRANSKLGCENASLESLVYNFGRCAAAPKVDHASRQSWHRNFSRGSFHLGSKSHVRKTVERTESGRLAARCQNGHYSSEQQSCQQVERAHQRHYHRLLRYSSRCCRCQQCKRLRGSRHVRHLHRSRGTSDVNRSPIGGQCSIRRPLRPT